MVFWIPIVFVGNIWLYQALCFASLNANVPKSNQVARPMHPSGYLWYYISSGPRV